LLGALYALLPSPFPKERQFLQDGLAKANVDQYWLTALHSAPVLASRTELHDPSNNKGSNKCRVINEFLNWKHTQHKTS
jgi:hypothetical protein